MSAIIIGVVNYHAVNADLDESHDAVVLRHVEPSRGAGERIGDAGAAVAEDSNEHVKPG